MLDHPNVIKVYEFYQDRKNYYLVTELCAGGELFDQIQSQGALSEAKAAEYMGQILSVVSYCRDRGIVHRDLKPDNFLLDSVSDSAMIKVADFGTGKIIQETTEELVGTPYYMAPEIF